MASSIIAVEWLNQNSLRNFPFKEDCSLRPNDSAGNLIEDGWRVPNYLITDIVIGVPGSDYNPVIYLKRLSLIGDVITLVFGDDLEEDAFVIGITPSQTTYNITGIGTYRDARGVIQCGDLDRFIKETPEGLYSFSKKESLIEPTCIRPSAAGIRSIAVVDASGYTTKGLQGDIKLVAGENIHIEYNNIENAIIISADPNSGYSAGCDCTEDEQYAIRSINGVLAEDVQIVGDECVSVTTENGIITISDVCSKPCCGCAEITFINQTVNDLQSSVNTLSTNTEILAERVTNFVNNYLLARKTLV